MRLPLVIALLAFTLYGCAKIPFATQWKLRSFRIETADLSTLRVAARAPAWIAPTPDAGSVIVSYWREDEAAAKKVVTVRLRRASHVEDESLAVTAGAEPVAIFEADPRDIAVAAAAQEDAKRMKMESSAPMRAEITIDRAACRSGAIPPGPIPVDLYVHVDNETGWLPFLIGYDLRPESPMDAEFIEKFAEHVPLCGKSSNRVGSGASLRGSAAARNRALERP